MSDKMTIVGKDGKPKYELDDSNKVIELKDHCQCAYQPTIRERMFYELSEICKKCNLPYKKDI